MKIITTLKFTLCITLLLSLSSCGFRNREQNAHNTEKAIIYMDEKSLMPIIISTNATQEVRDTAQELANLLGKICNSNFKIKTGNGASGIAVGTTEDFPQISIAPPFNSTHPAEQQGYILKSHSNGIHVIGATPQGVSYAVYDLLYRLGYRCYFPMEKWQIIPQKEYLEISVDTREMPDYYYRKIRAGYHYWPEFRQSIKFWDKANRAGGYRVNCGHAYDRIIRKNKTVFNKHPEYYGLLDGKRTSSKLCISNPGLRKLIADYAINFFQEHPDKNSISMEPSDGGGWCECSECHKLGTPSDRALLLANTAAEAIANKFPGKYVGMYAYNQHSAPPTINVHPHIVISIATSFIRNGFSLDEIITGWSAKGAKLGIREYYDVYIWSYNAPGNSRGSNINYLKKTIPDFYEKGARFMDAESGDDWGPSGLGYYLAQRIMWDKEEANNTDALIDDFIRNCFKSSAGTMKKFYNLLNGAAKKPLCSDLLGRMYRLLQQAKSESSDEKNVLMRINDLVIYTRYCELLMEYLRSYKTPEKLTDLMHFSARAKKSRMIHTYALYRRLTKKLPKEIKPIDWKNTKPITDNEITNFINAGIKNHKLLDFVPISFSDNLIPYSLPPKQIAEKGKLGPERGTRTFYTWISTSMEPIKLKITGGLIKHYRDRGNVKVSFYQIGGASDTGTKETLIQSNATIPPDGKMYTIKLNPKQPGLHKIVISDGGDMTLVVWDKGIHMTLPIDGATPRSLTGTFYFYIPKTCNKLGFFHDAIRGKFIAPDGSIHFDLKSTPSGFYSFLIPQNMRGKIWKISNIKGKIGLLTAPPYAALEPAELLLPQEIIKKDNL